MTDPGTTEGRIDLANKLHIAFRQRAGSSPGVLFCGGFRSDMQGDKARFLDQYCAQRQWQFTRFDYRGHGQSGGRFEHCNFDHWIEDCCTVLDTVCQGPQILVASSMGAWIAVRCALARAQRIKALLTIAAAPDFSESLIWQQLDAREQAAVQAGRPYYLHSNSDPSRQYPITMQLIESGRRQRVLHESIALQCPVRLLHGTADEDVSHTLSLQLLQRLHSADATLLLKKNADHRFSDPACLQLIGQTLLELHASVAAEQPKPNSGA